MSCLVLRTVMPRFDLFWLVVSRLVSSVLPTSTVMFYLVFYFGLTCPLEACLLRPAYHVLCCPALHSLVLPCVALCIVIRSRAVCCRVVSCPGLDCPLLFCPLQARSMLLSLVLSCPLLSLRTVSCLAFPALSSLYLTVRTLSCAV